MTGIHADSESVHRGRHKGVLAVAILTAEIAAIALVVIGVPHSELLLVLIEASIAVVGIATVVALLRKWRSHRRAGHAARPALTRAVGDVLHPRMARLLVGEVRVFGSIGRWIARAPAIANGAEPITYGRNLRPILLALVPVSLMEMGVVALLLHQYALVHWLIIGASAYGVLWLIGLAAAIGIRPHALADNRLTLRCMIFDELEVGLDALDDLKVVRIDGCKRSVEFADGVLTMSIMGKANVAMTFCEPVDVSGDREFTVREIRFAADAPDDAVEVLRRRRGAR